MGNINKEEKQGRNRARKRITPSLPTYIEALKEYVAELTTFKEWAKRQFTDMDRKVHGMGKDVTELKLNASQPAQSISESPITPRVNVIDAGSEGRDAVRDMENDGIGRETAVCGVRQKRRNKKAPRSCYKPSDPNKFDLTFPET